MTIDSVDDFILLLIGISLAFAIAGIAFQVMRLLSKVSDSIGDLRRIMRNFAEFSDFILDDYLSIRKSVKKTIHNFSLKSLLATIFNIKGFSKRIQKSFGKSRNKDKN